MLCGDYGLTACGSCNEPTPGKAIDASGRSARALVDGCYSSIFKWAVLEFSERHMVGKELLRLRCSRVRDGFDR